MPSKPPPTNPAPERLVLGMHLAELATLRLTKATALRAQVWLDGERLGVIEQAGCACACSFHEVCRIVFHGDTIALHLRWMDKVGEYAGTEADLCEALLRAHDTDAPEPR
ncbi:hypothetical protein ACFVWN_00910 [Nocardiopsis flavescens]|uniref:hypothetical protein n=1 Tax=Nocardiopsis flavescens TaxID=758803 RepID=UPI0036522D41